LLHLKLWFGHTSDSGGDAISFLLVGIAWFIDRQLWVRAPWSLRKLCCPAGVGPFANAGDSLTGAGLSPHQPQHGLISNRALKVKNGT
jgi:hypothetical protein